MWNWILHVLGVRPNSPTSAYNFWSGFGSDAQSLVERGVLLFVALHQFNCHEAGCLRIGRFHTAEDNGHDFRRCKKHHTIRHEENEVSCPATA